MFAKRMACDLAWDYALYTEFFKKKGDATQAKEKLSKTIELMQGCNADGWIKKFSPASPGSIPPSVLPK
jgi:hypothetical protein